MGALLLSGLAFGQTFEIADVHASPKTLRPARNVRFRGDRFELKMATMVDLIAMAYGVEPNKVADGPSWLETDRYDVIAKAPEGATPQTLRPMLQALLADRFGLTVHLDQRPAAAYVLSPGNGKPKLKESEGSSPPGCQRQPQDAVAIPANCRGLTMEAFAQQLRGLAGDYLASPVVNGTKLEGAWDFTLKWTPRGRLASAGADGINIFDAIDSQLGLKLELKQIPAPVVVVDRVDEKPTDNSPDVAVSLAPSPPPSFEVATIKPSNPQSPGMRIQTPPNGQVSIQGVPLSFLIQTIWFVTPEMIVGAPKWLDADRWDITAKVFVAPGSAPQTDMDSMIAMVRQLLEDRFKLETHMENRVVQAYTLTATKPRLQQADPTSRSGCNEGPGADGKDPRVTNPMLSRLITCRNMSMTRFAELLPNIANALNPLNGYIRSTVLDSTGLDGAYDFTVSFTPTLGSSPGGGPPLAGAEARASDPNGSISISDALSQQLGLKLSLEKRRAAVLVIDHIEQKPADN